MMVVRVLLDRRAVSFSLIICVLYAIVLFTHLQSQPYQNQDTFYPQSPNYRKKDTLNSRILKDQDGRYVLSDVFVWEDFIYFVTNQTNITFQPVLCSVNDKIRHYVRPCKIIPISQPQFVHLQREYLNETNKYEIVHSALIMYGLNCYNSYHIVWESMIPALSMLLEDGNIPRDPTKAISRLQDHPVTLFMNSWDYDSILNRQWWEELLPNLQFRPNGPLYLVQRLILGTRGRCAHFGHCSNSSFYPPDSAIVFRNLIAQSHNLTKHTQHNHNKSICRITVVQRKGTRTTLNFDELLVSIRDNESLGQRQVRSVDFSDFTIREQINIAASTDVFILVHGGALVHVTWLPPGATIMDINPYMYFQRGLINWMRYNLKDLHLGHHLYQVNQSQGQFYGDTPMIEDCICHDGKCQVDLFLEASITVDIVTFSRELSLAVERWRNQAYDSPLSNEDYMKVYHEENVQRQKEFRQEELNRQVLGLPPRKSCV